MDGSDFVTAAEFARAIDRLDAADLRIQNYIEQTNRNIQTISESLAVHLAQQKTADERDRVDRQRIFLVTLAVIAAFLTAVVPPLLKSVHLISGVVG